MITVTFNDESGDNRAHEFQNRDDADAFINDAMERATDRSEYFEVTSIESTGSAALSRIFG